MTTCKAPWRTDHDLPDWMRVSAQTARDPTPHYRYFATKGDTTVSALSKKLLSLKMGWNHDSAKACWFKGCRHHGWTLTREIV